MLEPRLPLTAEGFWQFSLQWYGQPQVAPACLALQDEYGLNVNMALLLAWCCQQQLTLAAEQWTRLEAAIQPTEHLLQQHRSARKATKIIAGATSAIYMQMKSDELALEREQQRVLIAALSTVTLLPTASRDEELDAFVIYAGLAEHSAVLTLLKQVIGEGQRLSPTEENN